MRKILKTFRHTPKIFNLCKLARALEQDDRCFRVQSTLLPHPLIIRGLSSRRPVVARVGCAFGALLWLGFAKVAEALQHLGHVLDLVAYGSLEERWVGVGANQILEFHRLLACARVFVDGLDDDFKFRRTPLFMDDDDGAVVAD